MIYTIHTVIGVTTFGVRADSFGSATPAYSTRHQLRNSYFG